LPEAEAICRRILARVPDHAGALHLSGLIANERGEPREAIALIERAIELSPAVVTYRIQLGQIFHTLGDLARAAESFREAARVAPGSALALSNLAAALGSLGQLDEALAALRAAVAIDGSHAEVHYNLAVLLTQMGQSDAAAESYRGALARWPDFPAAVVNYGNLLCDRGELDAALAVYERAIRSNPRLAVAHFNRGNVHYWKRDLATAVAAFEQAIRLQPDNADAYNNLAAAHNEMGNPDLALEACRKGIELTPERPSLYSHLAFALHALARGDEAVAARRRCLEMQPADALEHANLLYGLNFQPRCEAALIFHEHLEWARRHAEPLTRAASPHDNDRTAGRRLRIGYVSPFFRVHAVSYFSEPLIAHHDRTQFEIYCYSDLRGDGDTTTNRFLSLADQWRNVAGASDEQLARQVRDDKIDILVDLTGHIRGNRLLAFARRPAPVQVTYLGYQNTTGMSAMNYRLTDAHADPPGETDRYYREELIRLEPAFFCFRPPDDAPEIAPLPALSNGYLTFGSFNNLAKLNDDVLETWLTILRGVPGSRLRLLGQGGGSFAVRVCQMAQERGLNPDRILFLARRSRRDYLQLFADVDVALDPFPFTGHTTTCESLWMGVPVISLEGTTYASRFGGSALVALGLEDWIGRCPDDYVARAQRSATRVDELAVLRHDLRRRMADSPLMNCERFSRQVEAVYRRIWQHWCQQA
jgi:protein O-GlcNAc transferase